MTNAAEKIEVEAVLADGMARHMKTPGLTKRAAARLAIGDAITTGVLPRGSLLPPETHLAQILGVSLGTVQAALRELQRYNIIVRRRGDGTRVASNEALGKDTWHLRFLSRETGAPLRIQQVDVKVERTRAKGPWQSDFSTDTDFLSVRRLMRMDGEVDIGAEMILPLDLFPRLARTPPKELRLLNIRPYLAEHHDVLASRAEHEIVTLSLNDLDAKRFSMKSGSLVFEIAARAYTHSGALVYYQRILAPCSSCTLSF